MEYCTHSPLDAEKSNKTIQVMSNLPDFKMIFHKKIPLGPKLVLKSMWLSISDPHFFEESLVVSMPTDFLGHRNILHPLGGFEPWSNYETCRPWIFEHFSDSFFSG